MVPPPYLGIWRRDWIDRYDEHGASHRDLQPAIWFQSRRYHVDLRIDPKLANVTTSESKVIFERAQIAFAGSTVVNASDGREMCSWHPRIAYPRLTDEVDAGFMHFESAAHVMEHGLDGRYLESWRRINHGDDAIRCLQFVSSSEPTHECFLMLCGPYFALGSNCPDACNLQLPVYAWGECCDSECGNSEWIIRESIAPWNVGRLVNVDQALIDAACAPRSIVPDWTLPLLSDSHWRLIDID